VCSLCWRAYLCTILRCQGEKKIFDVMDVTRLFGQFGAIKVGVVGDMMLDTYLWGHVERISPEAPVPVVTLDRRGNRMGGAGNVALNLASLGARVTAFSVIGNDADGRELEKMLEFSGIYTE